MIKEFRVARNNRLFKEVLADSSTVKLMNRSSDSPFVKYRNYKNPEARRASPRKSRELANLIRDYFARLEVDFTLIELTKTEVKRAIAVYFAKINDCKLTESQLALINDLSEKTARERRKEAHQSRFKKAKSLRLFLKGQNIVYFKSSKEKNNFEKIKRIHDAYLEKKPYDKIQKKYLEKLKRRTRDLSNNFNNSQSKTKPGLILTKLQDVEDKMIKKEKDQEQERFSKERYAQDYEKWFPENEYQRDHQRQVQDARKSIFRELEKINRSLENFDHLGLLVNLIPITSSSHTSIGNLLRSGLTIENQLSVARFLHLYELIQRPYEAGIDYEAEFLREFNSKTAVVYEGNEMSNRKLWDKFDQEKIERYVDSWIEMKENPSESIFDDNKFFSKRYPKWYFNTFKPNINDYYRFLQQSSNTEHPDFWHWYLNTYLREDFHPFYDDPFS